MKHIIAIFIFSFFCIFSSVFGQIDTLNVSLKTISTINEKAEFISLTKLDNRMVKSAYPVMITENLFKQGKQSDVLIGRNLMNQ